MKLAAAPISCGVSEVPGWGMRLGPERVLGDMNALGGRATEAGSPGFLPENVREAGALLEARGLRLVGGFVTAVLHGRTRRATELASLERQATWLASAGAVVLVLDAAAGATGYATVRELPDEGWRVVVEGINAAAEIRARRGLVVAVHPHFGTVIERARHVSRFLDGSIQPLCLDTGHVALGGADPVKVARDAGTRVRHVHLRDLDAAPAERVRAPTLSYGEAVRRGLYRTLGEGVARIGQVLEHLRKVRYSGRYVLAQDVMLERTPAPGPPEWVARSVECAERYG